VLSVNLLYFKNILIYERNYTKKYLKAIVIKFLKKIVRDLKKFFCKFQRFRILHYFLKGFNYFYIYIFILNYIIFILYYFIYLLYYITLHYFYMFDIFSSI